MLDAEPTRETKGFSKWTIQLLTQLPTRIVMSCFRKPKGVRCLFTI